VDNTNPVHTDAPRLSADPSSGINNRNNDDANPPGSGSLNSRADRLDSVAVENPDPLLTLAQAAAYLGGNVTIGTLREWRRQRRITVHKLGRHVLIRRSTLDRFITDNTIPARARSTR
jgi:excisionase family DNA binding protein